jgi:hypothetical protein
LFICSNLRRPSRRFSPHRQRAGIAGRVDVAARKAHHANPGGAGASVSSNSNTMAVSRPAVIPRCCPSLVLRLS